MQHIESRYSHISYISSINRKKNYSEPQYVSIQHLFLSLDACKHSSLLFSLAVFFQIKSEKRRPLQVVLLCDKRPQKGATGAWMKIEPNTILAIPFFGYFDTGKPLYFKLKKVIAFPTFLAIFLCKIYYFHESSKHTFYHENISLLTPLYVKLFFLH